MRSRLERSASSLPRKAAGGLRAAKLLHQGEEYEVVILPACSAMFYVAEALLDEKGLALSKHSALHAAFGKELPKTGLLAAKYHRWPRQAFDDRRNS